MNLQLAAEGAGENGGAEAAELGLSGGHAGGRPRLTRQHGKPLPQKRKIRRHHDHRVRLQL